MRFIKWLRIDTFSIKRTVIAGIILTVVVVCMLFSLPMKTVSYDVTETYYVTETKEEAYTANEPYETREPVEKTKVLFDESRIVVPLGVNIPFKIDKPDAELLVHFNNPIPGAFYIFTSASHLLIEKFGSKADFQLYIPEGNYTARFSENAVWGETVYIRMVMKWTEIETKVQFKEVTKYRDVPVEVKKQRVITKYKKTSMWESFFD